MKRLEKRLPLLFDGAMGTYYMEQGTQGLPICELANLFDEEAVIAIHQEYIKAGANALRTNSFGANMESLHCDMAVVDSIVRSSVDLARKAIGDKEISLFADIGPIPEDPEENKEAEYKRLIDLFLEKGVRDVVFETFSSDKYLKELCRYIREQSPDSIVIVSFAIQPDGYTRAGLEGEALLHEFAALDAVDAVGFNCISGPFHLLEYSKRIQLPKKTLAIMPNAGYPSIINNRTFYSNNATYYANLMSDFMDYGFEILGGCCGTTPTYIEKMRDVLATREEKEMELLPRKKSARLTSKTVDNLLIRKIQGGRKVIAVEYDPPSSIEISEYMENVRKLKDLGIDAITIADCPVGRARIDSSLMGYKIKNEIGIDPIVHLTCRDRNINATKALLLGLNVEDILNLIIVTGDPIPTSDRDEIKGVYQFNSRLLTRYIASLNDEIFTNPMNISGALNINAHNFESELRRAIKKEEAGVSMFFTQPVLSQEAVENLRLAKETLSSYLMGGIMPIVSHRNAVFMNEEISGIRVDRDIIARYEGVDREGASRLGVELSLAFMEQSAQWVDGYYIITPFNRIDLVEEIIRRHRA